MLRRLIVYLTLINCCVFGSSLSHSERLSNPISLDADKRWASYFASDLMACRTESRYKAFIKKARSVLDALKVIQIEDQHLDIRLPLMLSREDELKLARLLSKKHEIELIRHYPWNFRDGYIESLVFLAEENLKARDLPTIQGQTKHDE